MFRFSIRELMLLTLVVAMGLGWGVDRTFLAAKAKAGGQAASDARMLVYLTRPDGPTGGWEAALLVHFRQKYRGVERCRF